jgi:glycerol-3-phosphate acyltransferase PlsY
MKLLILFIVGCFFGNLQFAYLITKLKSNIDIREHGSNNAGASNVTSVLGLKIGFLVAVLDILKAYIPVGIANHLLGYTDFESLVLGTGVIIGHIYPILLNFKGGKGVAAYLGTIYGINFFVGLISNILFLLVTFFINYIFIASLSLGAVLPLYLILTDAALESIILATLLFLLLIYKHRINIVRLYKGEETSVKETLKKHSKKG